MATPPGLSATDITSGVSPKLAVRLIFFGRPSRALILPSRRHAAPRLFALCALFVLFSGCTPLPALDARIPSSALTDTGDTRLGSAISPLAAAHPGLSGVYPLQDALEAFAARVLLARGAERSLDVQYYIWRQDLTGTLLFRELEHAAARGVRVRLLLDDNNTAGLDPLLAALDAHPRIEVRLFNPFRLRKPRLLGYLTDFARLNRRMHNKSFTADNQATIIGGRNIGDEYFGAGDGVLFSDLDVLAAGPAANEVSADFDRYWNSASASPVASLLPPASPRAMAALPARAEQVEQDDAAAAYMAAIRDTPIIRSLEAGRLAMEWVPVRMVSDDPAKGLGRAAPESLIGEKLKQAIGDPESELLLVSPYFVPTATGVEVLTEMARQGVQLKVLTNALEATDVAAVHAGYAKRRKALLQAGITLYETRRLPSPDPEVDKKGPRFGSGASASSLHAKTFSVDRSRIFIGSFNFDPRSARLNTEMGFVIESPALAGRIAEAFGEIIPQNAYEVRLSGSGSLYWIERQGSQALRHDTEPGTRWWQRAGVFLLSLLPIEWLL